MTIFLDLDGTLLDVSERHYQVYCQTVHQFGGTVLGKSEYWEKKRQKVDWTELIKQSGLEMAKEVFLEPFITLIESPRYLKIDQLFEGSHEALQLLSAEHDLYLLTLRRHQKPLEYQIELFGLQPYFKKVLFGHAEGEGYQKKVELAEQAGTVGPSVWIGDTEADILAAQEIGATVYAVTSGIRDEYFLAKLKPDHLVGSFVEAAAHVSGRKLLSPLLNVQNKSPEQ